MSSSCSTENAEDDLFRVSWVTLKPSDPESHKIGIPTAQGRSLEALLSHYTDLIVYLGFSMWRKMLIYLPPARRPQLDCVELTDGEPIPFSVSGCLGKFTRSVLPKTFSLERRSLELKALDREFGEGLGDAVRRFARELILCDQRDCVALLVKDLSLDLSDLSISKNEGRTALHFVALVPTTLATARVLLRHGANVDARTRVCGRTPVVYSSGEMRRLLIEEGNADVNVTFSHGTTILHDAAGFGSVEHAQYLLQKGVDLTARTTDAGDSALGVALRYGRADMFHFLVGKGAPLKHKCEGNKPTDLHNAPDGGNVELVKYLLDLKEHDGSSPLFDIDEMSWHKDTALQLAAQGGHTDVVRLLCERGAKLEVRDNDGETALFKLCAQGEPVPVKLLLEMGASVEAPDAHGFTPLLEAVRDANFEVVKLLLAYGADPNAFTGFAPPLHQVCKAAEGEDEDFEEAAIKVVNLLIEAGANPTARDSEDLTALEYLLQEPQETQDVPRLKAFLHEISYREFQAYFESQEATVV